VLDQILLLLHPFMPFVTEELWQKTQAPGMLIAAEWPSYKGLGDTKVDAEMSWVIDFISQVRSVRAEMNIPAGAKIACVIVGANTESRRRAATWEQEIVRLARLKAIDFEDKVPASSAQMVLGEAVLALPLEGVIDFAAERARLGKELEKVMKDVAVIDGRLSNPGFVAKAPGEVLEEARERKAALGAQCVKLEEALSRLK
jgi:valyl-tRNA synthetase